MLEDRALLAVDGLHHEHMENAPFHLPAQHYLVSQSGFLTGPHSGAPLDIALGYLHQRAEDLGLTSDDFTAVKVTSSYVNQDTGISHIYLRQTAGGLEVSQADINVAISALGEVISVGGGFVPGLGERVADGMVSTKPVIQANEAVERAAELLGLSPKDHPTVTNSSADGNFHVIVAPGISLDHVSAQLQFVPVAEDSVALSWELIVRTPDNQHWYELSVDGSTGAITSQADWFSHASYTVLPIPTESPDDGPFQVAVDPHLAATNASPFGWHDTNGVAGAESTLTMGNNVDAHLDRDGNNVADTGGRPDGGASLNFNAVFNPALSPLANANAAVTNLFYWNNILHDVHYQYGFTSAAGNFQTNTYGQGGLGNDAVQADAQDNATGGSANNANFGTPPDGSAPRMQMFEFTSTNPRRDSDMDVGIVVHEYGHGVSNRLTGGPANASALNALQSGGMGEGWSDWWSLMFGQNAASDTLNAKGVGTYVLGQGVNGVGIRNYRYDFDIANQSLETFLNFGDGVGQSTQVHAVGTRWASTLWDLNHLLIQKYGYEPNIYNGTSLAGNIRALHLVMNGLKLQPANPSLLNARDAILAADTAIYGGTNQCEIWSAFARRGLGQAAATTGSTSNILTTSFVVPTGVCGLQVATTIPAVATTVSNQLATFAVNFSNAVDPITVTAGDFQVNGIPATSVVLSNGNQTATFGYNVSPIANQGIQTMSIAADAIARVSDADGIDAFSGTFRYDALSLSVTTTVPAVGGVFNLPGIYDVNFNEPIQPASIGTDDLALSIGTVTSAVALDSDSARYTISGVTADAPLTITLGAGKVTDTFGNPNPVDFVGNYFSDISTVAYPLPLAAKNPLGSLVYDPTVSGEISSVADTDSYTISVDPGLKITVYLDPATTLKGLIRLYDSSNTLLSSATNSVGLDAVIQTVSTGLATDTYRIEVSSDGSATTGAYRLGLILNAREEAESHNGSSNDTFATAEDINGSFIALSGTASRGAVLGAATGSDFFQFSVSAGDTLSIALQSLSGGTVNASLFDSTGVQITTAVGGATNVSRILRNFVAPIAGSYRVRVTAATAGTSYNLVALKNADFDREANDAFDSAQHIGAADGALGYVRSGTSGLGRVFVYQAAGAQPNSIQEINPTTGAILNSFASPTGTPTSPDAGMATTSNSLLVANDANGNIYELNPNTGTVIRTISTAVSTIAGLAFLNNEIYVRSDVGSITVLNYATGAVARTFSSPTISEDLAASGTKLYGTSNTSLYEVNTLSGAVTLAGILPSATNIEGLGIVGNELLASNGATVLVYDLATLSLLRTLTGFVDLEAVGADGDLVSSDDWLSFAVNAGDSLELRSSTPADGLGNFINDLNPRLELYSPLNLLVSSGTALADGRNETILHTATQSGNYRVKISAEGTTVGEYFISILGTTGTSLPPFQVTATNPVNGSSILSLPSVFTVDFNDTLIATTLQASDLKVNGINATAVTFVDGDTALFTLPAGLGNGTHTITIAAGAVLDIQNTPLEAYSGTFTVDPSAPRVTATSATANAVLAPGSLTYTVTFSEPMRVSNILSTGDFALHGNFRQATGVNYVPTSFGFNPAGTVLTLSYTNLPDDDYTLSLVAGTTNGTNFTDIAGNALDGEFSGVFPSGNGVAGGSFVIGLDMDLVTETYPVLAAKNPLGSLIYDSSLVRTIAFAADSDEFTLSVDPNQTVSIVVTPATSALQPRVELLSSANVSLDSAIASIPGQAIGIQTRLITAGGLYRVSVNGLTGTQGLYTVEVILNAAFESEDKVGGGSTNNTFDTAQNIDGSFISLDTTLSHGNRGAVQGITGAAAGLSASAVTPAFTDISLTGTRSLSAIFDDATDTLTTAQLAGFAFPFFGITYDTLSFNTNGLITFGGADSSFSNGDLSTSPSLAAIAVLWDDLYIENTGTGTASSAIFWRVVGTGLNQQLIIQWNNVRQLGGSIFFTLQAILAEDGTIQFNYSPSVDSSLVTSATVGVKAAGTVAPERLLVHLNQVAGPLVGPNLSTRITSAVSTADYYRFSVAANQKLSLALTNLAAGNVDVQLLDTNGLTVLASGIAGATNLNEAIHHFVPGAAGTYFARVSGGGNVPYSLVVTKDVTFDSESNNTFATAQSLNGAQGVVGHVIASTGNASLFDFESGSQGFTVDNGTTGLWHRTTQRGSQAGHSSVTSFHYGREAGTYNSGQRNSGSIVSPVIALPSTGAISFGFNYTLQTETSTSFDTANVQVSTDNFSTFTTIASSTTNLPKSVDWREFTSDLSAFAGQNIRIRWIFDTLDSVDNSYAGWFVDDVRIGIVSDDDWYAVTIANVGESLRFETSTPADGTGQFTNLLNPHIELYRPDGTLLTSGTVLADGRNEWIQVSAPVTGTYRVRVSAEGTANGEYFLGSPATVSSAPASVVNRQVFYNRSTSSAFGNGSGNPENAIDPSKIALLPGQQSTFANYTNYSRGLNGLIVDIANNVGALTAADFRFATWDGIGAAGFSEAIVASTITVLPGQGVGGSNRVKVEFEDHAIQNTWLCVAVLASPNTGLATDDVFYFGNAVAELNTGNIGSPMTVRTNATDTAAVRQNQSIAANSVGISNIFDVNKDGRVNAADTSIVRQNQSANIIRYFTAALTIPSALLSTPSSTAEASVSADDGDSPLSIANESVDHYFSSLGNSF